MRTKLLASSIFLFIMVIYVPGLKAQTYHPRRENLKLNVVDTIKISKSYYFSNPVSKDLFYLIIHPGLVKSSKSIFEIRSFDNKLLFSYPFNSFFFIAHIFEPDTLPKGGWQVVDEYLEQYWKSLTQKQYEDYFNKNIFNFFEDNIHLVEKSRIDDYTSWSNVKPNDNEIKEVNEDPSIILLNMRCFECDSGGGSVIYYSPKQKKIIKLFEGD